MFFNEIMEIAPDLGEYISSMPPELDGRFVLREYDSYSIIHQKDSPLERVGILLKGRFRVINEFENGNVFMIEMNEAISFVGEIALFAKRAVTSVTLEAVTGCSIAFLPVDIFSAWVDTDVHFMRKIAEHIASKLYCSSYNRGERLFYSSPYIFLKHVVEWAENAGIGMLPSVTIGYTRSAMSQILGMQEKTVNRVISKLEADGIISISKGKLMLSRPQYDSIIAQLPSYRAKSRNGAF